MVATGWLGWTPEVALDTPLVQINLALKGKIDFLRKTNPWGSSEERAEEPEDWRQQKPDPEGAARKLMAFVKAAKAKQLPKKEA
jgi:hypothetical protein